MGKGQTDYYLSKLSEDRWCFEDRAIEDEWFVSFISKAKPAVKRLEERLECGRTIRKRYAKKVESLVVAYYIENWKGIREKMRRELYFDPDDLVDLNRLYPNPSSKPYEKFDVETLFDFGRIHFTSGNNCIIEIIVSWDDCLIIRIENESLFIDHEFNLDDLYEIYLEENLL